MKYTRVGPLNSHMQAKQKVTLYLSPELHRKLKIRAAVDSEPMSDLAERAIVFYLANSELVDEIEGSFGRSHRVYSCPSCATTVALRDGEMVSMSNQPGIVLDQFHTDDEQRVKTHQEGEEELVPC
jgi:hypothetical protein